MVYPEAALQYISPSPGYSPLRDSINYFLQKKLKNNNNKPSMIVY